MDELSTAEDDPALLTLELILLDLTWIRLPKVDQDQLIIPTLCFKVLDFPLVTFSPQQKPTDIKKELVIYNQGKSCMFRTSLQLLSDQFRTYPIYSFLMDTARQPAPMVAFGSFPLQAILEDISRFTRDGAGWPTISAQNGQAYLRNTRGKRVALINFALRLSCLSEGSGVSGATGEPGMAAAPEHQPLPMSEIRRQEMTAPAVCWPQWDHPPIGVNPTTAGKVAARAVVEPSDSFESAREVRVVRRTDDCRQPSCPAVESESAQELRVVRLTDRPPVEAAFPGERHVAWGEDQQQWNGRHHTSGPPQIEHPRLEDVSRNPGPPPDGLRSARGAARSRSSSVDRPPEPGGGGGSCWRAALETDEGSLASDASSGPIVSRLIQELAAMQRATADSKHVAVQTKPLRELQLRGTGPAPPLPPVRPSGRRRARPPRLRRLPLISEEPVTEGFARRRPAGAGLHRRSPPPPPDTTAVDRLSRGQPVAERRTVSGRLRGPPARLRPVTLTRTAQLRLARHMADVRHDLHAQEYCRRRDRWMTEQRRRLGKDRPRAALPSLEVLPEHHEMSPPSPVGRRAPTRKRRGRLGQSQSPPAVAVKSIGVQFESDASPPQSRGKVAGTAKAVARKPVSETSSFVEPRLSESRSRSTELRDAAADNRRSWHDLNARKTPSDALNSSGKESNLIGDVTASRVRHGARRSQSTTAARSERRSPSEPSRSRSETVWRSAAVRKNSAATAASPTQYSEPLDADSSPVQSSESAGRRRVASSTSGTRLALNGERKATSFSSGGRSKSPASGGARLASAGSTERRSSGSSVTSSTLRTDRNVSEEVVSPARRSPPSTEGDLKTTSRGRRACSRRSSHQSASLRSVPTQSAPTQSATASEVEERISTPQSSSSSSSEGDSSESATSESSSTLTEESYTRTNTQTSATQTGSSIDHVPEPARRSGKSPKSGGPKPSAGVRPKPAPRGPPTWHLADDAAESSATKPASRAVPSTVATLGSNSKVASSPPARPEEPAAAGRSRSSSRDSAEIDARIAMFLRQSGERQQEREREEQRRKQEASAAPAGAGWLKRSSAAPSTALRGASVAALGGTSSWLKAWGVDDDTALPTGASVGTAVGGRRASRGRHTLPQPPAGLNTDSVSSYAPSGLEGGTLSDLTPP